MEPNRARGRARGRARSEQAGPGGPGGPSSGAQQPRPAWGPRPGGPGLGGPNQGHGHPQPQPQTAPPAWGPRPTGPRPGGPPRQPAPSQLGATAVLAAPSAQPTRGAIPKQQVGRATFEVTEAMQTMSVAGGGGDTDNKAGPAGGRGSVRGRRQIAQDTSAILMTRPHGMGSKQGHHGKVVKLQANYFPFKTHTDWCLYQYRVDFAPEEDRTFVKKKLFQTATKDILAGYLFDGSMLFTARRIDPDPMDLFVDAPGDTGEKIRLTLRLVGDVALGDYHLIQFFNIMMRKCLGHMQLQLVGRNFYDAKAKIPIPQYDIELWPGYITSIRQHEQQILLCCEVSHKFMRKEHVLNVIKGCYQESRQHFKKIFMDKIIGAVVLTDYNNRTYRVDDVDWEVNPKSTFSKSDGTSISYIEYYKQRYQLNISDTQQPMLVSRAKSRELRAGMAEIIYLIPELCRMTGLAEHERSNMQMMRALADHTRLAPSGRIDRYMQYSQRMQTNKEIVSELNKWDMKLDNRLVDIQGRQLPMEMILQGENGAVRYDTGAETDWTRNLRANKMFSLCRISHWTVIVPSMLQQETASFVQVLQKAAGGMALRMPPPEVYTIRDDKPATYLDALESVINNNDPNFILCVASNNKVDRYSAIKKKCCVDRAVPTQVILRKNITNKNPMSIATKVAIQINCKLGGAPWTVEMPLKNLMVVGFDVCHDATNKGKSYGAMVASLDRQCTRYYSTAAAHTNGEELSNDFALSLMKAVKQYVNIHKVLPERIIIYRDGVGDGQLPYVYNHEVKAIKDNLASFYKETPLRLAFVVVTKRINTRIFANGRNPAPGTVVDSVITLPQRYDFYIVSQCVRQGTVAPTSYNVLYDTLGIDPDKLQRLTYKFTHLYYNWSGTVRVPAPCQYAHKLAFLVSQALHRNPNPQLSDLLYFL